MPPAAVAHLVLVRRMRSGLVPNVGLLMIALATAEPAPLTDPPYLMPITAYRPYEESVQRLLGNKWGYGTMIYSGGVTSENDFAVAVWGADDKPKTLTLLRFAPENDHRQAKAKSEINVPIDSEFVEAIEKAWCALLLKTRYPPKIPIYADGWTAEFSCMCTGGPMYGTGCPAAGFAKELMDFGFELKDYCTAKQVERKEKRDSLIPRLRDFTARVTQSHLY